MFFSVMWLGFFTNRAKLRKSAKVMGQIKLIPGVSHPAAIRWSAGHAGRDKPLATAAPIEGVKGGGGGWTSVWVSGEQGRAAACCPHQAPLRIFHREFTSLDTTGKLQEWRSNLSLLASMGSLFFSQVPFPERPSSRTHM